MIKTGVAVAGLLAVAAIASAQPASALTIDDAVALALKGNREVQSAALDVYRAREGSATLKTTRLPQFQIYVLSGELLRQVTFSIPQGALGTLAREQLFLFPTVHMARVYPGEYLDQKPGLPAHHQ